jgi:hypothetical protein
MIATGEDGGETHSAVHELEIGTDQSSALSRQPCQESGVHLTRWEALKRFPCQPRI